jgi:hypothetical protein
MREVEVQLHALLTSALDEDGWLASSPGRLTLQDKSPETKTENFLKYVYKFVAVFGSV